MTVLGVAVALIAASAGVAKTATASGGGVKQPPGTGVSRKPVPGTPHFSIRHDNPIEQVRQLVQCGDKMYAVGSFSQIVQGRSTFARHNIFSFRATAPFTVTSWTPKVNGTVNSIAFQNGICSHAYIGGSFTSVNGRTARNIAKISTRTGAVVPTFARNASAPVETLVAVEGHILVGGYFKLINRSSDAPYLASLNPATGRNDGFVRLHITGHYQYPGVSVNATKIYNQALSHNRRLDLVMGDFRSVGGRKREQIFMLNLGGRRATVTSWTSRAFKGHCAFVEPFYVRAASWSPNDRRIYIATTGRNAVRTGRRHPFPLTGLCDVAAAFPAARTSVRPIWVNYTGCDSLYSTAADGGTAYFGGHERWSRNRHGCNTQGRGAYPAPGMEGLSPNSGAL
ncbi:MAG: hypothetical protein JO287_04885, partial [Pseudonocardiales bacterium]|nr:hypothetical protein [Pseudonocardiales bacterium]